MNTNFMQVLPGGHCLICHKDFEEMEHPCWTAEKVKGATLCGEKCKDSKYQSGLVAQCLCGKEHNI